MVHSKLLLSLRTYLILCVELNGAYLGVFVCACRIIHTRTPAHSTLLSQNLYCSEQWCGLGFGLWVVWVEGIDTHHTPKVWVRYPVHTRYMLEIWAIYTEFLPSSQTIPALPTASNARSKEKKTFYSVSWIKRQ